MTATRPSLSPTLQWPRIEHPRRGITSSAAIRQRESKTPPPSSPHKHEKNQRHATGPGALLCTMERTGGAHTWQRQHVSRPTADLSKPTRPPRALRTDDEAADTAHARLDICSPSGRRTSCAAAQARRDSPTAPRQRTARTRARCGTRRRERLRCMGEAAISGCNGPELQLLLRLLAHTKERYPTARACARRAAPTCYFTRERHQDVSEQVAHSLAARDTAHSSSK